MVAERGRCIARRFEIQWKGRNVPKSIEMEKPVEVEVKPDRGLKTKRAILY